MSGLTLSVRITPSNVTGLADAPSLLKRPASGIVKTSYEVQAL